MTRSSIQLSNTVSLYRKAEPLLSALWAVSGLCVSNKLSPWRAILHVWMRDGGGRVRVRDCRYGRRNGRPRPSVRYHRSRSDRTLLGGMGLMDSFVARDATLLEVNSPHLSEKNEYFIDDLRWDHESIGWGNRVHLSATGAFFRARYATRSAWLTPWTGGRRSLCP